ncbi:MAG: TIGR02147 family protein [Bdellovibrionales bacterium]
MKLSIDFYSYDNPIQLLNDYIEKRKACGKTFSYRWFSQKAGFSSPNYLHLILKGQRALNLKTAEKVATVFKWKGIERKYFLTLSRFNQSSSIEERNELAERLFKIRLQTQKQAVIDSDSLSILYSSHLNVLIYGLSTYGLENDALNISKLFIKSVSSESIEKSIKELIDGKILIKKGSKVVPLKNFSSTGDEVSSTLIKKFHTEMMLQASESMDTIPREERDISGVSILLDKENYKLAKEKIQKLRKELLYLEEQSKGSKRLFHIGNQIFPITKGYK